MFRLLHHSPLWTGYVDAYSALQFSSPQGEPCGVPPSPSAAGLGEASGARPNTPNVNCWFNLCARLVAICCDPNGDWDHPMVIPCVYSTPIRFPLGEPVSFPWQTLLCSSCRC